MMAHVFASFVCLVVILFANSEHAYATQTQLTLRVALYPYVPLRRNLFFEIEQSFERSNPGVNVELVESEELLWDYYSGGLLKVEADVYEIDTILLADMITAKKIQPIALPTKDFTKAAREAVTRGGVVYAVPHWICGNFLFYRRSDTEVRDAKTWSELLGIFQRRKQSLFVDFKGKSTLGEWYLSLLASKLGVQSAQQAVLASSKLDDDVLNVLRNTLKRCPAGYCRNDDLHDRVGFYARAFVRGHAGAYVGYSESLHYGLQDALEDCLPTSGCLTEAQIGVRRLPSISKVGDKRGLGWVDGLSLSSKLTDAKLSIAKRFIEFLVSDAAYKMILEPEWGEAPKYLLPARRVAIKGASLYPALYDAHSGRRTGTVGRLNEHLRELGKRLDCALPVERTDTKTARACSR